MLWGKCGGRSERRRGSMAQWRRGARGEKGEGEIGRLGEVICAEARHLASPSFDCHWVTNE